MKIVVFADGAVGFEIVDFLLTNFRGDVERIICISDNEILKSALSSGVNSFVFEGEAELIERLKDVEFDVGVLAWWPKIISSKVLHLAKTGFINTHNSYLPNNRGKYPYFWAIVEQRDYGVTLHWVDAGIDTGDIIAQKKIEYGWEDTAETLYHKSLTEIAQLFRETYPTLQNFQIPSHAQTNNGSFHTSKELDQASEIYLDQFYRARDLLNIIRARTTSTERFKGAFFNEGGEVFRVKLNISKD